MRKRKYLSPFFYTVDLESTETIADASMGDLGADDAIKDGAELDEF